MAPYSSRNGTTLEGKCVAITGANTGIGKATAIDLSRRGARILMLCRSEEKSKEAIAEIKEKTGNDEVVFYKLNLASLASVRECAEEVKQEDKIDMLINNAGVMKCPNWKTDDGFDMQFGTNHLGHFLLTELLLPLVKKSAAEKKFHPRIILVSSLAHEFGEIRWDDLNWEKGYDGDKAYCMSKLANVMHGKELARRLEGTGISVYSLHPGVVNTDLARHMKDKWYGFMVPVFTPLLKTPLQGAQTTLYCALEDKIKGDSGNYYSDCKEKRPQRRALVEEDQKKLWKISEEMVGLKAK